MSEVVDMTSCKIGMWTVLYRTSNDTHGKAVWHCRCECGNEKDISGASLRNKSTLSCGCSHRSHNTFDLSGDYAVGYDNSGNSFLFDKEEYSKIKPYYWRVGSNKYVSMVIYDRSTKKCTQYQLHRFLMNPTNEEEVDHINHNTLDNRKSNLRIVTTAQNQMNSVVSDKNRKNGRKNRAVVFVLILIFRQRYGIIIMVDTVCRTVSTEWNIVSTKRAFCDRCRHTCCRAFFYCIMR